MKPKVTNALGVALLSILWVNGCTQKADHSGGQAINSSATMPSTNDTLRVNQPRAFERGDSVVASGTNVQLVEAAGAATARPGSDGALAGRLRTSFQSDPLLAPLMEGVRITSNDGKIILSGVVQTEAQKQSFFDKAREIAGEGRVENKLQVRSIPDLTPNKDTQKQANP